MAQFKFPLSSVLKHRERIEQEKQRDLAAIESQMREQQAALDRLNRTVQENVENLKKNRLIGPLDLTYLTAHRRYMLGAQRQATTIAQRMSLIQRQIDDARAALVEAAKQRKILEKLQERQKLRWSEDQARREVAELDDATMRAAAWASMGVEGPMTEAQP